MTKMKMTKKQKQARKAFRRFNACLDADALRRSLSEEDKKILGAAFDKAGIFPDEKGLHLLANEADNEEYIQCDAREKDLRRAYPPGMMLPVTLREHEKKFTKFSEWMVNQHDNPATAGQPLEEAAKAEWSRIMAKMNEIWILDVDD